MSMLLKEEEVVDFKKTEQFLGQVLVDLSANYSGVLVLLGMELGLYKAMRGKGRINPAQLAAETNTYERYIREWLNNQAAGGYIIYHPPTKTYELPEEHALVLIEKDSPFLLGTAYYVVNSLWNDKEKLKNAFVTGSGIGWHEHHHDLFHGVESVYRSGYLANLTSSWIPALEGMEDKLNKGGRVADVGCGHGASTILMAERFPNTLFYGFDYHEEGG